ncbi:DUF1330 domain-containing protein [Ruania zhangjianzhongii]|uniref:DUF1330 domain-containing protein n=1 Tax=Ruania zhangjianzhongii TaxID=2603206 RepID=UPI001AEFB35E|nr:DUF1330 domain-containing protein [Ruania zhangjianzhongii]
MNDVMAQNVATPRGYAVALLRDVELGPEIWQYMETIEATFAPFGGEWVIHGTSPHVVEGVWPGDLVIIGFPSLDAARAWYDSAEYAAILALRADHSEGAVALVEGVPDGYRAASTVAGMKAAAAVG